MMQMLINGFSMAYTDAGQGLPVLFVHGYPLNRLMWQPQVDELSKIARVIAPDMRGHGDSEAVPGPYSMEMFADDLNALLDALGITQKIVLCGLSMGGYTAFAFYRKYATRLAGLVLTATRAAPDSTEARLARMQAANVAREQGLNAIVEGMLPRILSPKTYQTKPELVAQVRAIMFGTSLEGVLGDLSGLRERPDSTPTLAQINIPTLLLPGADDPIVPLVEAQAMYAAISGARMQVIPDAGHLPNLENPAAFNQALSKFLEKI
jgi:3-oxoadipate enol-lactonase